MSEQKVSFAEAFAAAGGVRSVEPVPYPLTHEHIRAMCERREALLRIQFEDERFDDRDEAVLVMLSVDHPDQAFQRYQHLIGLWHIWERGYSRGGGKADADTVRWQMLAREPIKIRIAGRDVDITARGRAAMIRLHRHESRRSLLNVELEAIERRMADTRSHARHKQLLLVRERVETEWEHHFRGILANSLTPDASAALPDEAPNWWDQVTAEDETVLLIALIEVGPGRMERGAKPRKPRKHDTKKQNEPITFGSLLRYFEPRLHLPPMGLEDKDLPQLITALEDGAADGAAAEDLESAFT